MENVVILQKHIRQDPDGYQSDFLMQLRHYEALLSVFKLRPEEPSKDFATLLQFISSVSHLYPNDTRHIATQILNLLEQYHELMEKSIRKTLVQSLMQLRQRRRVELMSLLPLFFRLFSSKDKALKHSLFAFIVSDIKASHRTSNGQNHLDRQMKGFLLKTIQNNNEAIAKKALAILTDLWRRQVWHDVHTANVIATALQHPDNTVMYATVKFFLGYDLKEGEEESDDDEQERLQKESQLCTEDVYKAQKKGTRTSKRKKIKKLKRVKAAMMRQARKQSGHLTEQFAAIQLLQDPYKVAETLFSRVRHGKVKAQTRLAAIRLLSRIVAVHRLVMLNFYPYLQKYLVPGSKDMSTILAALVEGCHEMIPPDAIEPTLRHLVNSFIHDHARPDIITVGLKTVRGMCARAPLIMNAELLSDLVMYKSFKDTEVRASAKGLVTLFREVAPGLLPSRERDRRAEVAVTESPTFGKTPVYRRIDGAELLQKEKETANVAMTGSSELDHLNPEVISLSESAESDPGDSERAEERPNDVAKIEADPESLSSLKKQLQYLKTKQKLGRSLQSSSEDEIDGDSLSNEAESASSEGEGGSHSEEMWEVSEEENPTVPDSLPLEMTEILNDADFRRLQELKREEAVNLQMRRYGLKPGLEKSHRLTEAAEADAEEWLRRKESQTRITESGIDPNELLGKKRGKANKTERMLSVLRGRETDSQYQSRAANKKQKTGGLSNREKIKRKKLPYKGRLAQAKKRRRVRGQKQKAKNFKGHVRKH